MIQQAINQIEVMLGKGMVHGEGDGNAETVATVDEGIFSDLGCVPR